MTNVENYKKVFVDNLSLTNSKDKVMTHVGFEKIND